MASVWIHPNSKNWFARYRGAKAKTVNRSTGTPDRKEALRIAGTWEIEAARERDKITVSVSAGGISDAIAKTERLARQGRLDAAAAREIVNQILAAAGQQHVDAVTNRNWCDSWAANKSGSVKEQSSTKYRQMVREWLKFLNGAADKPLDVISREQSVAFRESMVRAGLAPSTINHTLKILRGVYTEAVEQGHIGRNPFAGVGKLRSDDNSTGRAPFTKDEVAKLIATAVGDWKGLVLLGATTGLRLMDAARLRWGAIDLVNQSISIKTAKTGATLLLPMHRSFSGWLKGQTRGIAAAWVFPSLAEKSGAGKSGLSSAFKRLMERAKIAAGVSRQAAPGKRGRTTSQKSFHSLRHFAATQLAAAGVRADIARQITGHLDADTHADYVTPDLAELRNAVKAIRVA